MRVRDPRFGGISSLTIDHGRFLAVSDRGSVAIFDPPGASDPAAWIADLRDGPGPWGKKWSRDAESLVPDPGGRGWWIGYEQNHSLWLYDPGFQRALASIGLHRSGWWDNRGAEGLVAEGPTLLAFGENGRDAMLADGRSVEKRKLHAGTDVADASRGPDGRLWLLLRDKRWSGITQFIASVTTSRAGYRTGPIWPVPKGLFDNYEGMAVARRPGGGLRFWLITDDGHRIMARTLLVALDYVPPAKHDESPATSAGLSRKPNEKQP